MSSQDPACTSTVDHEVWISLTPPYTYRALVPAGAAETVPSEPPPVPDTGGLACPSSGGTVEVGSAPNGESPLRFVPPNTLAPARQLHFDPEAERDPWAGVRDMIDEGRAHREGTELLDGRTVERVRFDPPASCPAAPSHCPTEPEYGYFDSETLYPVAWDYARDPMFPLVRNQERYLVYEYLRRTDDNLALTDIRAQHPNATGP
jgi:hypothetical protein